jgi:SPP1 family predicted phage head-tail adaptor
MRAGRLDTRVSFYAKVKTASSDYGGTTDTWPVKTFETWGNVRFAGGDMILSNEEKFYSGVIFLEVRYRDTIVETMRVEIEGVMYRITYIEELGRDEGMKITLQKIND